MNAHHSRRLLSRGLNNHIQGFIAPVITSSLTTTTTTTTNLATASSRARCPPSRSRRPFTTGSITARGGRIPDRDQEQEQEAARLRLQARNMELDSLRYTRWSKDALIRRIQELEAEARARDHASEQQGASKVPNEAGSGAGVAATATAAEAVDSAATAAAIPGGEVKGDATAAGEGSRSAGQPRKGPAAGRKLDPSRYATRAVALKLAYLGRRYGGFEYQASSAAATVEEELWRALVRACLIFPEDPHVVRLDDPRWEYSKCGRTDRGVSAFGQVVGIRVRSNRPLPPAAREEEEAEAEVGASGSEDDDDGGGGKRRRRRQGEEAREFDDVADEIQYPKVLNRILPKDIRVLAWCPAPPAGFSARHDCRERQYRYFFTQPAFPPIPSSLESPGGGAGKKKVPGTATTTGQGGGGGGDQEKGKGKRKEGWLDIDAMRDAAKRFEGLHDFRNFCKVDASKLITSFERRIFEADVVEVPDAAGSALPFLSTAEFSPGEEASDGGRFPKVYYIHVRGSAFLWHQIRCMAAVLFMVGQGLEAPSIIDRLLDPTAQPQRPNYVLANETPLVLWDCVFPDPKDDQDPRDPAFDSARRRVDTLRWARIGDGAGADGWHQIGEGIGPLDRHNGLHGLADDLWTTWRERKMDELLAAQLLGLVAGYDSPSPPSTETEDATTTTEAKGGKKKKKYASPSQRLFVGGNCAHVVGQYQPLQTKALLPSPAETYEREARKRGFGSVAEWREARANHKRAEIEAEGGVWVSKSVGRGGGGGAAAVDEDADE